MRTRSKDPRGTIPPFLLAAALLLLPRQAPGTSPLPPVTSVGEAKQRLVLLEREAEGVEEWVEKNWEAEFSERHPGLSRGARGPGETEEAYRARQLKVRMAASDLRKALRKERAEWIGREKQALLAGQVREPFPVRLGPYDSERREFPLLLGFGWPAAVSVRLKVPWERKDDFPGTFPREVTSTFRINEKGEVYLVGMERAEVKAEPLVSVNPPGPRLLWQGSHESWITAVSLGPDGQAAVSGGGDGALGAWDAETGNLLWRKTGVEMALGMAHAPDGSAFATGGADSMVRLRDGRTGEERWAGRAGGMVFSVSVSPDGRFVASGDDDGHVRIWSVDSGTEILRTRIGGAVRSVSFSPGGRSVALGTDTNWVLLWELASNRVLWSAETDFPVFSVDVSAEAGLVAAGGGGDRLVVLRLSDGSEVWNRKTDGEIRAVRFDPAGRLLAAGGAGYHARIYGAQSGDLLWSASVGSPVRALSFGPGGSKILVGSADFGVQMFEVDEGDRVTAAFSSYGRVFVERSRAAKLFR